MRAIIPVAGVGTRLRPHTHTQPKALIPVAGKPILAHIVDSLIDAGFDEFVYIIGYLGEKIQEFVEEQYPHLQNEFVVQTHREGIGHALFSAREHIENQKSILIALGDTVFDMDMKAYMALPTSALGTKEVDDPRRFGVAEVGADGYISRLVEKPANPVSKLALVGIYKIDEAGALMDAIKYNIDHNIRTKNEFQLTDALQRMIEMGVKFVPFTVQNWFDCGKREALIETNAILLEKGMGNDKEIIGLANFKNSIIIPPVHIHPSCEIKNSILGPNVSIGPRTIIDQSIIKDTIVGPDAEIRNAVLHDSLVGNEAILRGHSQSLNLGDSAEIDYA